VFSVMKSSELASASAMKKHKSLEDLQTNGIREEEEDACNCASQPVTREKKSSGKTARACGVNESFRAAIDRSYDPESTKPVNSHGMTAFVHFSSHCRRGCHRNFRNMAIT